MSNINQWKLEELPNSKIILTEEVYNRLMILIGRSTWVTSEHRSFLFGKRESNSNTWIINSVNENEDYVNTGNNSINPAAYSVHPGEKESREVTAKLESGPGMVIIDVHTHPSGITDDYRFFSRADLEVNKELRSIVDKYAGTTFTGLIGVDRINGNMSFSIIWYNKLNDEFYRVKDILLRQKDEYGRIVDIPFPKYGDTQLIFKSWGADDLSLPSSVELEITNLRHK